MPELWFPETSSGTLTRGCERDIQKCQPACSVTNVYSRNRKISDNGAGIDSIWGQRWISCFRYPQNRIFLPLIESPLMVEEAWCPLGRTEPHFQISSAISLINRSFAHCCSSVRILPSSVEAKPHWGLMHNWSIGR